MALYKKTEALTQIPWYYLATIDQYVPDIRTDEECDDSSGIQIGHGGWFGPGSLPMRKVGASVRFLNGKGRDGNGDKQADPENPEDILYTIAHIILDYGHSEDDIKI